MSTLRNMLTVRNLSLFRAGLACANCVYKDRFSQLHKSNFHKCMSRLGKHEESSCTAREYMYEEDYSAAQLANKKPKKVSLRQPFARLTGRYQLMYTCTKCNTRNTASISKVAYHHGAVVASCTSCKANHLIADNLKWFGDKKRNIETIMKEKGESVMKITSHDLFLEVLPPDAPDPVSREEVKKLPPLTV